MTRPKWGKGLAFPKQLEDAESFQLSLGMLSIHSKWGWVFFPQAFD